MEQRLGFQGAAAFHGAPGPGVGVGGNGFLVAVDNELGADVATELVAEGDHLRKLKAGVDVQQREGDGRRVKRLARQVHHHGGVLANGVEHDRTLELRGNFAENEDAFGLQRLEIADPVTIHGLFYLLLMRLLITEAARASCNFHVPAVTPALIFYKSIDLIDYMLRVVCTSRN